MPSTSQMGPNISGNTFMIQTTGKLRKILQKNPNLGDEYVERQLKNIGKGDLFFSGVANAIRNNALGTEHSYLNHPGYEEYLEQLPDKEKARIKGERRKRKLGEPYSEHISKLKPWQEEYQQRLGSAALEPSERAYSNIGAPIPLEGKIDTLIDSLLSKYEQGPSYFEGPGMKALASLFGSSLPSQIQPVQNEMMPPEQPLQQQQQQQQGSYNNQSSIIDSLKNLLSRGQSNEIFPELNNLSQIDPRLSGRIKPRRM